MLLRTEVLILNKISRLYVSLASRYGSRVPLAMYTAIFWFASLLDEDYLMIIMKVMSTETTFGFCLLW